MKGKWILFSSIFYLVVGVFAITAFLILGYDGENMTKWVVSFILSIIFILIGVIGIVDYKLNKKISVKK